MNSWAASLYLFYDSLKPPQPLPHNIDWLYPQKDPSVMRIFQQFLQKYYSDFQPRTLFLGINPGRFGAGVTGVNFTAPKQLKDYLGIDHPFRPQSELSAEFIYEMINAYGGPDKFYARFFIGSVCPLGFISGGKNINYYDDPKLCSTVEPFITDSISQLCALPHYDTCLCIGGEKNYRFLSRLNEKQHWFRTIIPLPHPRFVMQYRRKRKDEFIQMYLDAMCAA